MPDNFHLVQKTVLVKMPVVNPLKVVDDSGRVIGSANLRFVDGSIALDLVLEQNHPAAFSLDTENGLARISLNGFFDDTGLDGVVFLKG